MEETKNLCAQIPLELHAKVCEMKEKLGLTTSQYGPVDKMPNGHRLTWYGGRKKTPHGVNLRFVSIF